MRSFILADNQPITCLGLHALITAEWPGAEVVHTPDRATLLAALRRSPRAVVVVDYALFDFASEQQMLNAMAGAGDSSWLLFFDEPSEGFLRSMLVSAPGLGLVGKNDPAEDILAALRSLYARETYICDTAAGILRRGIPPPAQIVPLTAAEQSVLRGIALGKTTKEIAWEKNLSFHTVNTHRRNIFRKLGINNLHEAVRHAFRQGIVDAAEYIV